MGRTETSSKMSFNQTTGGAMSYGTLTSGWWNQA